MHMWLYSIYSYQYTALTWVQCCYLDLITGWGVARRVLLGECRSVVIAGLLLRVLLPKVSLPRVPLPRVMLKLSLDCHRECCLECRRECCLSVTERITLWLLLKEVPLGVLLRMSPQGCCWMLNVLQLLSIWDNESSQHCDWQTICFPFVPLATLLYSSCASCFRLVPVVSRLFVGCKSSCKPAVYLANLRETSLIPQVFPTFSRCARTVGMYMLSPGHKDFYFHKADTNLKLLSDTIEPEAHWLSPLYVL